MGGILMEYILQPAEQYDRDLFCRLDGIAAIPFGGIGFMFFQFENGGTGLWEEWYDTQNKLKTAAFDADFDAMIEARRSDGANPPLASRDSLEAFCATTEGVKITHDGARFIIQTAGYSYFFYYSINPYGYDIGCAAYDNRWFLPTMACVREIQELLK
jgi:hypothetical protein